MISTAAASRPHSDAVVTALNGAGLLVGRGKKPDESGWQGQPGHSEFKAYLVLYPSPGAQDGNLADPNAYFDFTWQLTCVAATQDGALAVSDLAKATLAGQRLTVTGRSSYPVTLIADPICQRDDAVSPPVHYCTPQFRVRTQPA